MTPGCWDELLRGLQKLYGKQADGWLAAFRASIDAVEDDVAIEAYHVCVRRQAPGLFPTIDRFGEYVDQGRTAVKARENRQPMTRPQWNPNGDNRNVARGREDLAMIARIVNEGYTDAVVRALGERWPGIDWANEAAESANRRAAWCRS